MSLTTPSKIRELQIKLYRKAKNGPEYRFYRLYDKVYREDILLYACERARANKGAPGVDGQTLEQIESAGLEEWLTGIGSELRGKTYQPQPVRRVTIPKARRWRETARDSDEGKSRDRFDELVRLLNEALQPKTPIEHLFTAKQEWWNPALAPRVVALAFAA